MHSEIFTPGFARRATAYKRPGLLFHDVQRLRSIAQTAGSFQIIYAGKAHPQGNSGKDAIRGVFRAGGEPAPEIKLTYLPNYEMDTARLLVSGVVLWPQHAPSTLRSVGDQRHEGGSQRRAQLQHLDG